MNGKTPIPGYPGGGGGKPLCILRKFGWVQNKKPVIARPRDSRVPSPKRAKKALYSLPFSLQPRFPFPVRSLSSFVTIDVETLDPGHSEMGPCHRYTDSRDVCNIE